ncbi:hypothetical protein AC249_AIPGENE1119 [Exaiptasia diaphana]|nr:hypothetical protein AC249_AIPGENE1119 [Exaiptasia diaphana]
MSYPPPYPQQQSPYPSAPPPGGPPPVGYEGYQQGPPPGYSQGPYPGPQYAPPQYGPPGGQYGPPAGQYGPPGGTVYTQQPNTVYVYEERKRDTSGEECFMWGLLCYNVLYYRQ